MAGKPKYIPEAAIPETLRAYLSYRKHHAEQFTPSIEIPIADTDDPDVLRKLVSYMKLHPEQAYGVVYQSRYNTVLVDPIQKIDGTFYPYERVLPTAGASTMRASSKSGKPVLKRWRI